VAHCWEMRGCDEEMWSRCPHNGDAKDIYSPCPADCFYADCVRSNREVATDFNILLDPLVDRTVAKKECCTFCSFFLTHAPRMGIGEGISLPAQTQQVTMDELRSIHGAHEVAE
jgi:hypothetical protein